MSHATGAKFATMFERERARVYKILLLQYLFALLPALLLLPVNGVWSGSLALGGLLAAIPNTLVARAATVAYRADDLRQVVGRFYGAQMQKLLLTGLLFAVVFYRVEPLNEWLLFGSFIAVSLVPALIIHVLNS